MIHPLKTGPVMFRMGVSSRKSDSAEEYDRRRAFDWKGDETVRDI
jgi:hypothetical protein